MIMTSWILSLIFMFLMHPLSLGFTILLQTIIISLCTGLLNLDFWFSYILFLIMVGGMLVLFIYMTSIASNEKFKFSFKMTLFFFFFLLTIIILSFSDNHFLMMNMSDYNFNNQSIFYSNNLSMSKYMNFPSMLVMVMMMIYLLLTLIAIVKITQSKTGPLRTSI
uniref:NADH-ubiquinone oxidoreductase chain 6 n=1 Tax=Strophosoma melanogrammum TaxID=202215 RepID=J9PJL6_STRME|nr:NADH dehydrogenase subunit 6 [Strophosoma melanogrammum]